MKLYAGTHLLLVWYRFLGARIGRRVMIHDMGLPPDRAHLWTIGSRPQSARAASRRAG